VRLKAQLDALEQQRKSQQGDHDATKEDEIRDCSMVLA